MYWVIYTEIMSQDIAQVNNTVTQTTQANAGVRASVWGAGGSDQSEARIRGL